MEGRSNEEAFSRGRLSRREAQQPRHGSRTSILTGLARTRTHAQAGVRASARENNARSDAWQSAALAIKKRSASSGHPLPAGHARGSRYCCRLPRPAFASVSTLQFKWAARSFRRLRVECMRAPTHAMRQRAAGEGEGGDRPSFAFCRERSAARVRNPICFAL